MSTTIPNLPRVVLRVTRPHQPDSYVGPGNVFRVGARPQTEEFVADLPGEILLATDGGSVFGVLRREDDRFLPCMRDDFLTTADGDRYRVIGLAYVPTDNGHWQILAERLQV